MQHRRDFHGSLFTLCLGRIVETPLVDLCLIRRKVGHQGLEVLVLVSAGIYFPCWWG